ncbi:MAG: carbon starvation protein A [Gemmatimonadota bacterium]
MPLLLVILPVLALYGAGYLVYGRFLARRLAIDPARPTPACVLEDGMDYVPSRPGFLFAQHFSAISAAGPIIGPILAALWFGWVPALLWIALGCVFLGAAHDFASLVASVRHGARSVADVMREHVGRSAFLGFLAFIWIALLYVIVAFTDITASLFTQAEFGGGVATSSLLYLGLAVTLGLVLRARPISAWMAALIFGPLLLGAIWAGQQAPIALPELAATSPRKTWDLLILAYCFIAAVLPMWLLLQPRGFLGGFLLYGFLAAGVVGLLFGGLTVQSPAFLGFRNADHGPLFPILFVTIACGACSGFHGLVCSGTTSKQLSNERDAPLVGYGAMLAEGVVALIALSTVMIGTQGGKPDEIFASGIARFLSVVGVPIGLATAFGFLALTTFIYDTLDVTTRLARYILQELFGWKGSLGRYAATAATIVPAAAFLLLLPEDAYAAVWSLFGTSNQLLAALTLTGIAVWLYRTGRSPSVALYPLLFLLAVTVSSLVLHVMDGLAATQLASPSGVIGLSAVVLLILSASLVWLALRSVRAAPVFREAALEPPGG